MAFWKQLAIAIVILVIAAVAWIRFMPGAADTLARWGWDWALVLTPEKAQDAASAGGNAGPAGGKGGSGGPGRETSVVAQPVGRAVINDRLSAIGTGRAINSVVVKPYAAGRLAKVLVTSGAIVKAGDEIAVLDTEAEQIALDRARIALDDANSKLERITALRSSNTVTKVQQTDAELAVKNAELALRNAELDLAHRSITAPISGTVGILEVSEGNYVTAQTELVTIDDRSRILVDFWVPERYSGLITVGGVIEATSIARPNEVFAGAVSAVDNRIDAESRTLHVQAAIDNPDDALRAGMSFRVSMHFPGDAYPAVDPLAIQWGSDGAFVWAIVDGKARRTPVRVIQRNTDSVLVDADLDEGTPVVTEGIYAVREGAPVRIAGDAQQQLQAQPAVSAGPSGS